MQPYIRNFILSLFLQNRIKAEETSKMEEKKSSIEAKDESEEEKEEDEENEEEENENGDQEKSKDEVSEHSENEEKTDSEDDVRKHKRSSKTSSRKESAGKAKSKKITVPNKSNTAPKKKPNKSSSKRSKVDDDNGSNPKVFSRKIKNDKVAKEKASTPARSASREKSGTNHIPPFPLLLLLFFRACLHTFHGLFYRKNLNMVVLIKIYKDMKFLLYLPEILLTD